MQSKMSIYIIFTCCVGEEPDEYLKEIYKKYPYADPHKDRLVPAIAGRIELRSPMRPAIYDLSYISPLIVVQRSMSVGPVFIIVYDSYLPNKDAAEPRSSWRRMAIPMLYRMFFVRAFHQPNITKERYDALREFGVNSHPWDLIKDG